MLLVTLDVKNAFNTTIGADSIAEMQRRGVSIYLLNIILKYFMNRTLAVGKQSIKQTAGVPRDRYSDRPYRTSSMTEF